jgi:hypothetical protein
VVEHRIARLVQLGIRQARYVGRTKALFQLLMAAAVANLTLLANAAGGETDRSALAGLLLTLALLILAHRSDSQRPEAPHSGARPSDISRARSAPRPVFILPSAFRTAGFRPGF